MNGVRRTSGMCLWISGILVIAGCDQTEGPTAAIPGPSAPGYQQAVQAAVPWTRQFGSSGFDAALGVAMDGEGVYVAGFAGRALPDQVSVGCCGDAFVRRYDFDGTEIWTRQFGTAETDGATAISVDGSGVYLAGTTSGALPGQTRAADIDVFVRRYDLDGNEIWTRQFGTAPEYENTAHGISVHGTGVYVAGAVEGTLPGQIPVSDIRDAFVRKYDLDGNEVWTRQFGTSEADGAFAIAADGGGVYVAGRTDGTLPDQTRTSVFGGDVFVRKYDVDGNEIWTRQFGTAVSGEARGISVDGTGVYVVGRVSGALPGQVAASPGFHDAFVRKYDLDGNEVWTRQFGSSAVDAAWGVSVDGTGVYVAGEVGAMLPGQTSAGGSSDAFVRKYDDDGNEVWTRQFGSDVRDVAQAVAARGSRAWAGGLTEGVLPGQTSAGDYDAFVVELGPPLAVTEVDIDVKPGDAPNSINPTSQGRIAVAILTTTGFDAATVIPTTVRFGRSGTEAAPVHAAQEDVDRDGDTDLVLQFRTRDTGIRCGDTSVSLTGGTTRGEVIQGSGAIKTVGCR